MGITGALMIVHCGRCHQPHDWYCIWWWTCWFESTWLTFKGVHILLDMAGTQGGLLLWHKRQVWDGIPSRWSFWPVRNEKWATTSMWMVIAEERRDPFDFQMIQPSTVVVAVVQNSSLTLPVLRFLSQKRDKRREKNFSWKPNRMYLPPPPVYCHWMCLEWWVGPVSRSVGQVHGDGARA
jgi:hypothetical protein